MNYEIKVYQMGQKYIDYLIRHRNNQSNYEYLKTELGYKLDPVFKTKIDIFYNVKEPKVAGQVRLIDLLEFIRRDHLFYPDAISNIILINNKIKGEPGFEKLKSSMPLAAYNANFLKYKKKENLISPTNIMFLDIDNFYTQEEMLTYKNSIIKKYKWIIACYQSISKKGLHILAKVDKIYSNEDFNSKYEYVNQKYFEGRLDKYAKSLTRAAIISNDINIYINRTPTRLFLNDKDVIKPIKKKEKNIIENSPKGLDKEEVIRSYYIFNNVKYGVEKEVEKAIYEYLQQNKLKFKIELDSSLFKDPNEPLYNWSGWNVVEMNLFPFLKKGIPEGKRTFVIGRISMELIYLNGMNKESKRGILNFIYWVNKKLCSPPLKSEEVRRSFENNWKKYQNGDIDFSSIVKKKRSIWSPECQLNRQEKISKSLVLYHKPLKEKKKNKILEALNSIHENNNKITQKEVALITGFSIATIKNYWKLFPEIKERVNELNLSLKRLKL
jgi:hypothetical protein